MGEPCYNCSFQNKSRAPFCTKCGWTLPTAFESRPSLIDDRIVEKLCRSSSTATASKVTAYDPDRRQINDLLIAEKPEQKQRHHPKATINTTPTTIRRQQEKEDEIDSCWFPTLPSWFPTFFRTGNSKILLP